MANHLILGLGGTGGKVLREFRRRLFEEYGNENFENPKAGEYFEYVYVDSSTSDLNESWKTMATDLSLGESQKVNIHSVPLDMLNNLQAYPGLDAFMNTQNVHDMNAKIGQSITAGIGGQRRRLGRILLASNLANISDQNNFEHAVRGAVGRLYQKSERTQITFHICAGLAGGTGSGTVVDAISLIRKWFPYDPQSHNNKILLLMYVPENVMVNNNHDAGYYQANGYAALQEINALALGQYKPYDITGGQTATGDHARIASGFEAAYIYSNVTENGNVKDLQKRLPSDVAEFLFQSISISGGQLQRLTDCENNPPTPENDQSGTPAHSCQFMTFGVARVEYPEVEIRQYATYRFALQAVHGLLYNHWVNGDGYGSLDGNQIGLTYSSEVREPGTLQRFKLSDDYLTLCQPILDEGKCTWQSLKSTWGKFSERAVNVVERYPQADWLNKISSMMSNFYDNGFRNMGVVNFYNAQNTHLDAYAASVCQHIENVLFKEWVSGTKSIVEVAKYVEELIAVNEERIKKYDGIISTENTESENSGSLASGIKTKYNNLNLVKKAIGKPKTLLHQYKEELEKQYRHATMGHAMQYAQAMLNQIVCKLSILKNAINDLKDQFISIATDAQKEAENRCSNNSPEDGIIRLYKPDEVRQIIKTFEHVKGNQDTSLTAIREAVIAMIGNGGHESFTLMKDKVDAQSVIKIILEKCERTAVSVMSEYGTTNPASRLIDVNILEKLRMSFTKPDDMKGFVEKVKSKAECNLQFDAAQSATVTAAMPQMIQLRIPDADVDADKEFRQAIINGFGNATNGFNAGEDVALCDKNNRIVVVCAKSNMPLRVMKNTSALKAKYDNLVSPYNQDHDFNRMLLHTESFQQNALLQLFNLTPDEVKKMAFEPLLLAFALGLLPQEYSNQLGQEVYTLQELTPMGTIPHELGTDFNTCWMTLAGNHKFTVMLIEQVNQELSQVAITKPQKDEIVNKIKDVLQNHVLVTLCNNDKLHKDWAHYNQEATIIIRNRLS